MHLSTSASNSWRPFALLIIKIALGIIFILWLFIVLIDPWGMLPISLPINRIPISTNSRYSMPALAINPQFDSAIIGNSTSRPLKPSVLNPALKAHFVNLSMNAATPWEQEEILNLFLKHHPNPKFIIINTDNIWTFEDTGLPNRPFPHWMYHGSRWQGYLKMANQYALQEAFNEFLWMIGLKKQRYGSDGFTPLMRSDFVYEQKKVDEVFRNWKQVDNSPANGRTPQHPALPRLQRILNKLPPHTVKILFTPPVSAEFYGNSNGWTNIVRQNFLSHLTVMTKKIPNTILIDFNLVNKVTENRSNFLDPIHYRQFIANMVMDGIIQATLYHKELPNNLDKILENNIKH